MHTRCRLVIRGLLTIALLGVCMPTSASQSYAFGRLDLPTGFGPRSVTSADFDGNGRADLAVANSIDSTVSVFLGTANGTFSPRTDYSTSVSNFTVIAADFNGDGKPDMAVSADLFLSVFMGNGDGTFQAREDYAINGRGGPLVAADLNRDAKLDLVVAGQACCSGTVSVLLGNGDGTFAAHVDYSGAASGLAVADFDGDGDLDLAVTGSVPGTSNAVALLLGNGDGTFANAVVILNLGGFAVSLPGSALAVHDLNADGKIDLAVVTTQGVTVLLGNGNGTFQLRADYPRSVTTAGSIAAADLSADGKIDLIVGGPNTMSVFLGRGDGTFDVPLLVPATPGLGDSPSVRALATADLNGDGKLDLTFVSYSPNLCPPCNSLVSVLLGRGDGTFGNHAFTGDSPSGLVTADFDADGYFDFAHANVNSSVASVRLGNGDGTFEPRVDHATASMSFSLLTGDFNADGKADLVVGSLGANPQSVLLGNGDGTFQTKINLAVTDGGGRTLGHPNAAGDVNVDGKLDLVLASLYGNSVVILRGNGNGTFQGPLEYTVATAPHTVRVADFNGDGKLDLAVPGSSSNTVSILLGNGDGTFQARVDYPTGNFPAQLIATDFNGDNDPDLAILNLSGTLSILLGSANGTFLPRVDYQTNGIRALTAVDFDRDGKLDVMVVGTSGFSLHRGTGDGSFLPRVEFPTPCAGDPLLAADLNGDGWIDLATPLGGIIGICLNTRALAVSPRQVVFETQAIGGTSPARTMTVSNPGNTPLTLSSISISGDFARTHDCPLSPATMTPGTHCVIDIAFSPTLSGTRTGTVTITDDAPGSPQVIKLVGNPPTLTVLPSALAFGRQAVATASAFQTITVTNSGDAAVQMNAISVGGTSPAGFGATDGCGSTLAAGAACSLSVKFSPKTIGAQNAKITLFADAGNTPQVVTLSGQGAVTSATLSATSLDFGNQFTNFASPPQSMRLTNTGAAPMLVTQVVATGMFLHTTDCTTVAPGDGCDINLTFHPSANGLTTGSLQMTHDAAGPESISLEGTGFDVLLQLQRPKRTPRNSNPPPAMGATEPTVLLLATTAALSVEAEVTCEVTAEYRCSVTPSRIGLTPSFRPVVVVLHREKGRSRSRRLQAAAAVPVRVVVTVGASRRSYDFMVQPQ